VPYIFLSGILSAITESRGTVYTDEAKYVRKIEKIKGSKNASDLKDSPFFLPPAEGTAAIVWHDQLGFPGLDSFSNIHPN
jgi:hypothetical protein